MSFRPPPDAEPRELPRTGSIRRKTLVPFLAVHSNTLDRWVKEGRFPAPHKFGHRVVAWKVEDVRRWLQHREGATG